jgi:hypothetical protein
MILRAYVGAMVTKRVWLPEMSSFDSIYRSCPAGHRYAVVAVAWAIPEFWCIDLATTRFNNELRGALVGKYLVFPTYEAAAMYALLRRNHADGLMRLGEVQIKWGGTIEWIEQ